MHFGMFAFMESICCHGKLKDGNTELERTTQMQRKCTRLPDCICVLGLRCLFPQHHLQVPMLPSPLVYFFFTPQNHIRQHPVPTALSLPACRTERWDGLPEHLHLTLRTAVRHYMHLHMHRAALNNSACWRASCFGYFCVDFFFFEVPAPQNQANIWSSGCQIGASTVLGPSISQSKEPTACTIQPYTLSAAFIIFRQLWYTLNLNPSTGNISKTHDASSSTQHSLPQFLGTVRALFPPPPHQRVVSKSQRQPPR